MTPSVVVTMAGFGRRFLDAGYTVPKYQIKAHGRTLFWWSMVGLRHLFKETRFVFVVRAADQAARFIRRECEALGITEHQLVELDAPTNGQATTALLALPECDPKAPMSIFNIDTHISPGELEEPAGDCDGWIPCFLADGDHWSFVRLDDNGVAVEVREKMRISPFATIGYYWFKSAALFAELYKAYYPLGVEDMERGEAFVAPLYNQLISEGGKVKISVLKPTSVSVLGTPAELALFRSGPPPALSAN